MLLAQHRLILLFRPLEEWNGTLDSVVVYRPILTTSKKIWFKIEFKCSFVSKPFSS